MKNTKIKRSIGIGLLFVLIFSTTASFAFSEVLVIKNSNKSITNVTFVEKSSGLQYPAKEGGKTELELADINNDGNLDIISVGDHGSPYINSDQHGIMVWLGDGIDSWSVHQEGDFGYGGIEAGDLNLDGYLDVVWGIHHDYSSTPGFGDTLIGAALGDGTASNWIGWAEGLGTGGEDYGMFATDLADFNCNGLLDIISLSFGCCNGYHQYENHGDGTWSHVWSLPGGNARYNIETCDFNSDGYPDFAGLREGTYVFFGDGSFDFSMNQNGLPGGVYNGLDCGDMNNDGCDDLVIGFGSSGIRCYEYDKQNNEWILASDGLPTSGSYYAQFGDINGDGFLDIIAYTAPIGYVYLGDGNGNWESDGTFTLQSEGGYSAFVVDGDFDHDGREDVVIQAEQGSWPYEQNYLRAFSPWFEPTELTALVQIPHGGETFRSGSIRNIRWLSGVPPSEGDCNVEIQVSLKGVSGPWTTIVSGIPNNGCYQWLVNAGGSDKCRIKVIVTTSKSSVFAISASDFKIIGFRVDAHGSYQGFIGETIRFTGSAENGNPPYDYYWDFGDGESSEEQNPTHSYDEEGNYTVTLTVTDDDDITISDSTWALIREENKPPNPPTIKGKKSGIPGVDYEYSFMSTDPNDNDLSYHIDWDDGIEEVIGVFPSGTEAYKNHTWTTQGTYNIRAKAEDSYGLESEWTKLTVTMPRNKASLNALLFKFLKLLPNHLIFLRNLLRF